MRISELRMKDVIEAEDGRRLGYINDMDIDPDAGRIDALRQTQLALDVRSYGRGGITLAAYSKTGH